MTRSGCCVCSQGVAISRRGREMPASPIRKLVPYADRAKERGIKVYHLNIGQPDVETPREMIEAYHRLDLKVIGYGPSNGLAEYLDGLVRYYAGVGIALQRHNLLVTTGGSEAITFVYKAITDPGDEVIIPEPFYTNYAGYACMNGITIVPVTAHAEDGFRLPRREEFEKKITDRTRAILFSTPGNPTGAVYNAEEMATLRALALAHNLYLVSDEVYREFIYDPAVHHQSVLNLEGIEDRAILVDSVSKRYSACGARIGCVASRNRDLMQTLLKFGQARLCPPTVDQIASLAALSAPPEYFAAVRDEYRCRRDLVCDALARLPGVVCRKPEGAFYVVAKLPVDDAERFAVYMLDEFHVGNETVMVAPADGFYATPGAGGDEVRIAYVLNCGDLARAMDILAQGIEAYRATKG